jgi:hypothetical protein
MMATVRIEGSHLLRDALERLKPRMRAAIERVINQYAMSPRNEAVAKGGRRKTRAGRSVVRGAGKQTTTKRKNRTPRA